MTTVSTTPGVLGANDQDLAPGTEVGDYKVEMMIGQGGFGTVYRAVHPLIGKVVAIKVLARKYSADPTVVQRFVDEARAVNQIRHRNIIDIFGFGQLPDGRHYYVMEHLDGEALDVYMRRSGPMSLAEATPILRSIARALDAAHAKGIAHRDLKPENIYLATDPDGGVFPKLLDFGIAKLLAPEPSSDGERFRTATGVPLGTPYYMSPEQCRGKDIDQRTDVYSFGIVAYRMLTGTYPFAGDDFVELLYKQVHEDAAPPSSRVPALPASVDTAIGWMMRKDREQRPATVLEAVLALDPGAATTPSSLPPRASRGTGAPPITPARTGPTDAFAATTAQAPSERAKPRPLVWIGGALVLVCAAVVLVVVLKSNKQAEPVAANGPAADQPKANARADSAPAPVQTVVGPPPNSTGSNTTDPSDTQAPNPATVAITVTKVPPHTTTLLHGKLIELPGDVVLAKGTERTSIILRSPGYKPRSLFVVPDHDQSLTGEMQRDQATTTTKPPTEDAHDTIHLDHGAFGGQPKDHPKDHPKD